MMMKMKFYSFIIVLLYLCCAHALYFHIGETERKCFIEEIPDETMVIGNYKVQLYDPRTGGFMPSSPGIGMHVEVKDPEEKTILSRVYSSEGRFTFTSHTPGEHVICLYSNSTKWFSGTQLRVHLDIQVGEHAIDYKNVAQKEKLTELQLRVRQLLDQVEQITKEQNYQRFREERYRQTCESINKGVVWCIISHTLILLMMCSWTIKHLKSFSEAEELFREERFRQTSESTNQRVLWWSIAQTCVLLVMGAWQMKHLKSFFEAKKLV